MFETKFNLGDLLRDQVSGFEGIVMVIAFYHTGCVHYGLASQKLHTEGKITDWEWIDESRLMSIQSRVVKFEVEFKKRSGIFPNPPQS